MSDPKPKVSVVIPTRNRPAKLMRCIESVSHSDYAPVEVVVVDDASDYDVKAEVLARYPQVIVLRNSERRLLSYSRNAGAAVASGEFLFFLDDDNIIAADAISELLKPFLSGDVGVVSPVIYYLSPPDRVWTSYIVKGKYPGVYFVGVDVPGHVMDTFSFHDAFVVRRSAFEESGRFDPVTFPIHFSELDFAFRLRVSGLRAVVCPTAKVWHDVGKSNLHVDSVRSYYTLRNRIILLKKYGTRKEFETYLLFVLPPLTLYYVVHHGTSAPDHRFSAVFNIIRGVVSGLAFPVHAEARRVAGKQEPVVRDSPGELASDLPLVSVVVPTKNSEIMLARCLDSLKKQTYPNIEIIVVDNHSSDRTVEIAKSFGARVFETGPERSAQVNLGVMKASGRYVYRVDGDFYVEPRVVEEAVETCRRSGFKVVTIHNTSDPSVSFWSRVRKLERDCYEDDQVNVAARFFDKTAFESVGGFDETMIASEDYDLHNRLLKFGFRVGRINAIEVHLGEPRNLREVVLKHVFYGTKINEFIRRNPDVSMKQLSPVRLAYVRHWRDFLRNPELTAGFFIYQYVRYMSAAAGYISTKL